MLLFDHILAHIWSFSLIRFMLNLVELGSYHLPLIHFVPKMRFVLLSGENRGFDRKKDFRSSFKEDRKSNKAPKKCRKQGEAVHGRAPGQHGRAAAVVAMHGRTHGRASDRAWAYGRPCRPPSTRPIFFRLLICFLFTFWGTSKPSFGSTLGKIRVWLRHQ